MVIPGILTAIGALALVIGLWGRRVGNEVRCRKCLFSLEGLASPAVCPECGRDVTGAKATRLGMRRRNVMVVVAALVIVLGGVSWLGRSTYTLFTAKGWENRVPGWWLVEVEGRWSKGGRLSDAIWGVQLRNGKGELADDLRTRLSDILFDRVRSSLPVGPADVGEETALREIAEWSTRDRPERVAELIAMMLFAELEPTESGPMPPNPGRLTAKFLPPHWIVLCWWRGVNAAGEDAGLSGSNWMSNGVFGPPRTHVLEPDGLPTRTIWTVQIYRSGLSLPLIQPAVYEFEVPWPGAGWKDCYPAREGQ